MTKLLLGAVLCFSLTGCGGGGSRSLAGNEEDPNNLKTNEVCYLGANSDNTACVTTKALNAVAAGYKDPFTDPNFMGTGNREQYRRPVNAIVLKDYSQSLKLAPNFIMSELMSIAKDTFGIYSPVVVKVLQEIRNMSQSVVRINSSFRSPKYNAGINGAAKWSRHQYGDAFDIASSRLSLDQLIDLCEQLGATYTDKYVAHVHCDWRAESLDAGFYGTSSDKNIMPFNRANFVREVSETSVLNVDGALVKGNVVYLSSEVQFREDTEEIYKKWEILTPSGQKLVYESSECALLLESGKYQVRHTIGAHAQVNQYFVVP